MISCQTLGHRGRLGNQLFQYAFLRTAARRLGVKFYCPPWKGDQLFCLGDEAERADEPEGIVRALVEHREIRCQSCPALHDGTDYQGYFQSPDLFDRDDVRRWYTLRPETSAPLLAKHSHIDFTAAIGVHVRLGDYVSHPVHTMRHYVPPASYYAAALGRLPRDCQVVLASDQPELARHRLRKVIRKNRLVLLRNKGPHDLYLLSRCRHLVMSPSTFSWWAGWLRPAENQGTVIAPREGLFRAAARLPLEPEVMWHQPHWTTLPAMARFDWNYWRTRWYFQLLALRHQARQWCEKHLGWLPGMSASQA
ncbi:MAG: alpha-1,2-fucosyltransferase [Pirellulaceae bacterium]|nr:alpha-1,2-fucosyltransferase [Pirellulaceae bacterium]